MVGWATHHHEGQGSKQPMVGWEKRKSATRAHHRMSPPDASQYRDHPTAHPGQQTGTPSTLTGAHTHHHQHTPKNHKPARENSLPPRTSSPHVPHTHKAPHTPPCLRDTTGQQRPGDNTHMRRGQLGPRQRKGAQGSHTRGMRKKARSGGEGPASMHSRGHGTGLQAASGDHKDTRNTAKPPGKPAGGPTTTHTQRQSHDTPGTPTGPSQPQSRPPQPSPTTRASEAPKPIFHHPSSTDSFSI